MIRFLLGLLGTAGGLYIAALYENIPIVAISGTQAFLMALSFFYILYEKKRIQVMLDLPPVMADQGEPVHIRLQAKRREGSGRMAIHTMCGAEGKMTLFREGSGRMAIHTMCGTHGIIKAQVAVVRKGLPTGKTRKWLRMEGGSDTADCFLSIAEPGSYEIQLRRVRFYDLTGLFYLEQRAAARGEGAWLGVLPRIYPMGISLSEAVRGFVGEAEIYDSARSGTDASETFKLRPFRDGDELRSIHWKLSAKEGELIVRENSMPRGCPVAVLVEPAAAGKEAALQCVASLSFCLMDRECSHYVVWYSDGLQDIVRARVDNEESYYEALLQLLREGGSRGKRDIGERYQEKYKGEPLLHRIFVGDGPCLRVDDREALRLKPSVLERELGEVELLL